MGVSWHGSGVVVVVVGSHWWPTSPPTAAPVHASLTFVGTGVGVVMVDPAIAAHRDTQVSIAL